MYARNGSLNTDLADYVMSCFFLLYNKNRETWLSAYQIRWDALLVSFNHLC